MKYRCFVAAIISAISANHALLAGQPSGYVVGWGQNVSGEATGRPSIGISNGVALVGDNPFSTSIVTIASHPLKSVIGVSAGRNFSLALLNDGTVFGWGQNRAGQAIGYQTPFPYRASGAVKIDNGTLSNVVSITAANDFGVALRKGGTIVGWGDTKNGKVNMNSGLSNVVAISGGDSHVLILKQDGTVECWGANSQTFSSLSNVVAISASRSWFWNDLALKRDGIVVERPSDGGQNVDVVSSNVVGISAGYNHSLALKNDGTVIGWGFNNVGQATGVPTTNSPYTLSGQVIIAGQVLSNIASIAAGRGYSLALKKDGTVIGWGRMVNDLYPVAVPAGLSNVVAIAAGDHFCLAITTNSAVAERFRP